MAGVTFVLVLSLTVCRSVLVFDVVYSSNVVIRALQSITSRGPSKAARSRGPIGIPRQQPAAAAAPATSKVRILHTTLLAMHIIGCVHIIAGMVQYMLPVSDLSCQLAHGSLMVTRLLYDASLVIFLLAKARVTNGTRALALWETGITWWSRFFAWVYMPVTALYLLLTHPISAYEERTRCLTSGKGEDEARVISDAMPFIVNNILLVAQLVLLLAMFVKPLLLPQTGTQSGGEMYRRVVRRNVRCTVWITFTYIAGTTVVVISWLRSSPQADQIADVTPAIKIFLTLCLTEIALPLGFSSCFKSIAVSKALTWGEKHEPQQGESAKSNNVVTSVPGGSAAGKQSTSAAVVPFEGSLP